MEQLITPISLENNLSLGDKHIPNPLDDVVNLEMIAYKKRKKTIVKQTQKKKKIDLDTTILCTTKE
jgi:hypothetical protein